MLTFTTSFAAVLRQQIDESTHEMVYMLTQKMGTIFNPLIQNATQTNQQLAAQMARITNLFGAPKVQVRHVPQPQPTRLVENQ